MHWQPAPAEQLLVHEWDGECVVFDLRSGDTHLLDARPAAVFRALQSGLQDADQVARAVVPTSGSATHDECRASVEQALVEFERLGLAERTAT
jgi:PqqD family protein of HPr-rel-A system